MRKAKNLFLTLLLMPATVFAKDFDSGVFGGKTCSGYEQWMGEVWKWSLTILIPLSVLVLSFAGVLYMTSGGNPDRVSLAKKLIFGVLSGVGLIILARVILVNVLGLDPGTVWNVGTSCK